MQALTVAHPYVHIESAGPLVAPNAATMFPFLRWSRRCLGTSVAPPLQPFHLAFPVRDIQATQRFYVDVLQCSVGRQVPEWIDFNFFGHQITAHVKPEECGTLLRSNTVDSDDIPVRHFGIVLQWADWEKLAKRCEDMKVPFVVPPKVRFAGEVGEQGVFFVQDPSGNFLEFKTFKDIAASLFQPYPTQ